MRNQRLKSSSGLHLPPGAAAAKMQPLIFNTQLNGRTTKVACSPYQAGWNIANTSGEVEDLSSTRRQCTAAARPLRAHAQGEAALGGDRAVWLQVDTAGAAGEQQVRKQRAIRGTCKGLWFKRYAACMPPPLLRT